jgi:hypothetical protein
LSPPHHQLKAIVSRKEKKMPLDCTPVSKCLEQRLKIAGFEIPDLILIALSLTVLNFLLGPLNQRFLMVWLPTLTAGLFFGKRGKPDKYLIHWVRHKMAPTALSAFETDQSPTPFVKLKRGFSS